MAREAGRYTVKEKASVQANSGMRVRNSIDGTDEASPKTSVRKMEIPRLINAPAAVVIRKSERRLNLRLTDGNAAIPAAQPNSI